MRLVTHATLAVASVVLGIWIWSRICDFPAQPWNDIRLAATVALAQGWSVYPTAEQGTINTWTYGPLPLLLFWPATWASTAGAALMIAAVLNVAVTLLPLAAVCFGWPAAGRDNDTRGTRFMAFVVCLSLWPERYYAVHSADNLAIACGLVANLILVRSKSSKALWAAALLGTAALACKQTAAGIPLAQFVWLALTVGTRAALLHVARYAVAGCAMAGMCIAAFGSAGLWFVLFELPAHFHWAPQPLERISSVAPELALQLGLPLVVMIGAHRAFRRPELLLPALAWLCALPLGLSALLKFGGRMNSVYSLMLWLPPVIAVLLTARFPPARLRALQLTAALLAAAGGCGRVAETPRFFLRPQLADYRDAGRIAAQLRGQVWFPLHPLVTLYSEKRYYHDEDGFFVRRMTHEAVTPEHAAAHLPPALRAMAFRDGWSDFGIARDMLPRNVRTLVIGNWSVQIIEQTKTP